MTIASGPLLCRCGHPRDDHEHYRKGTNCAVCGSQVCPKFRPRRSFLARFTRSR